MKTFVPEKINIGGVPYSVIEFNTHSNCEYLGNMNPQTAAIEIIEGLSKEMKEKTFIHESIHAIIEEYGISIPEKLNETITTQLTTGIYELIIQLLNNEKLK